MKCPLFMAIWGQHSANVVMNNPDCIKEACAWWVEDGESCSVFAIGKQLEILDSSLHRLIDKMPHEGQFRR